MKREIKFRGKTEAGHWLFGDLIKSPFFDSKTKEPCHYILDPAKIEYDSWEDIADQMDTFEVIPSSVGQMCDHKDKNGKGLYDGDKFKSNGIVYRIQYIKSFHTFCVFTEESWGWYLDGDNHFKYCFDDDNETIYFLYELGDYEIEWVATTHDNPERLS